MKREIGKDRAGLIPYILYTIYTVYMVMAAVYLKWPSWVAAVVVCGLLASIGLRILLGRSAKLAKLFCSVMIWMNIILYTVFTDGSSLTMATVAASVVMLSLFDLIGINYISLAATLLLFGLDTFLLDKVNYDNPVREMEFFMQFLAIIILELMENKQLKNRIQHEIELDEAMRELEEAEHAKDDFMANISHEIRTPLNSIIGIGSELLDAKVDDTTKEQLYDITVAGRNLMSLVSDILDFSELENDTMELVEEPYNITSVINDVVNMAHVWNKEKNLEIIVDCEADIPNNLLGDSQKIYRMILNLINNAIKFTDAGGVILFVGARKEPYGINLMVKVKDTGIGMSEKNIDALENTYNQVDTTRDRRAGGVGLGLAISRKMIAKMNGHMHIESVPDVGTTVSIIIPQRVLTDMPLVSVRDAGDKKIVFYMNLERYRFGQLRDGYLECIQRMIDQLHVDAVRCSTMHELKNRIEHETFQFLFVADVEYFEEQSYFDSLTDKMKVVVMANRDCDLQKVGSEVQLIYRPIHVFSIATVLNGEKLQQDAYDERWHHDRFRIKGAKILAVDDSAMNLKVVSSLLSHYGITIDTALSGKEAIEKISDRSYDLVFMDHMMPEMDGVECMHRIHELPGFRERKIPVIALTANAIGGAREMLIREGFDDFVAKPIEKSAMERVLRKYLSAFIEKDTGEAEKNKTEVTEKISGQSKEEQSRSSEVSGESEERQNGSSEVSGESEERQNGSKEVSDGLSEEENFEVAGIDHKLGLSYFDDNEADYMEIVQCFYEQGRSQIQTLQELYDKKDWENYKINIHSLKGQSLTIGAKDLSAKAKRMQEACEHKNENYIIQNHVELIADYCAILDGLSKYVTAEGEEKTLLQKLAAAIDNFDQEEAIKLLENVKNEADSSLTDSDAQIITDMTEQIELFDFISAAETLKKWGGDVQ